MNRLRQVIFGAVAVLTIIACGCQHEADPLKKLQDEGSAFVGRPFKAVMIAFGVEYDDLGVMEEPPQILQRVEFDLKRDSTPFRFSVFFYRNGMRSRHNFLWDRDVICNAQVRQVIVTRPDLEEIRRSLVTEGWRWKRLRKHPLAIGEGEVIDLASLLGKLKSRADPVSAYLLAKFSTNVQAAISSYPESGLSASKAAVLLAEELNRVVFSAEMYESNRFKEVRLRESTLALANRDPGGLDLARLNRLLLEDAYPQELKSRDQ